MANIALIIAGGVGARMGQDIPKQFINVNDRPVIIYTLEAFQKHPEIDAIEVVCLDGWHDVLKAYAKQFGIAKLENIVSGGLNGQDSIRNGLLDIYKRYNSDDDVVLIHDAIRPMLLPEIITDNIKICREYGNAITVVPCTAAMLKTYNSIFIPVFISKHQKLSHVPAVFFDRVAAFFLFSQIIPKSFQFILCFLFQCVSSLSHETFSRICFFRSCFFFHNCDHFSIF